MTLSRYVAWCFDEFVFITIKTIITKNPLKLNGFFYGYGFNLE